MRILGLNHGEINSSAAILVDGVVRAAAAEERFTRQKKTKAFPYHAARYCLDASGLRLAELDYVAQAWNPGAAWQKYNPLVSGQRIRREDYLYSVPDHLYRLAERRAPGEWVLQQSDDPHMPPIYYVQHHRTHAANAFYLSPFDEAAILTADWRGEFECTTFAVGRGTQIKLLGAQTLPHSLGMLYSTFTQLLGYRPDNDEWKVMALSSFEVDASDEVARLRETFGLLDGGRLELDQRYYQGIMPDKPKLYSPKLVELLGGREGVPGAEPDEWYLRVAKAMQLVAEDIALHYLAHLHALTGLPRVVLGGGFFMNSVFNGQVTQRSPFEAVYISHSPSDTGNSLGAALYVAHHIQGQARPDAPYNTSYLGPAFEDDAILAALTRRGIPHTRPDDIAAHSADLLAGGEIVAMLNGAMEFGERALGNRSILADPRPAEMKDRINAMIKYREAYRPFAPVTLQDKAHEFFDVPPDYECDYMEKVCFVRPEHRAALPAITHVDGSARLQTVREAQNPRLYAILRQMEAHTGYPVLLNTSFNINAEPIVCTPDDALTTFYNSGLRHLAVGAYAVRK